MRFMAIRLAIAAVFAASAFSASTAKASSDFYWDNSGTWHITSAQGILELKEAMDESGTWPFPLVLDNDIDMSKITYTPSATPFTATFDGKGHTITGMTQNPTGNQCGFFAKISGATIKNVTFDKADINKNKNTLNIVGFVVGEATGSCTFENVHVKNSSVYAYSNIGGLVGKASESASGKLDAKVMVKNCSIESAEIQGSFHVAGFCGFVQGTCTVSGSSLKSVTPKFNLGSIDLDSTITCAAGAATTCPGKGTVVKGRYQTYGNRYWAVYADLYTSGNSNHSCSLATGDGYPLAYSAIVHDAPYEVDGVLYSDKDAIPSVAKVGDTEYKTLAEAFEALSAENHTLTLLNEEAWPATTPVYWSAGTQNGYAATFADALTAAYKANEGAITIVCRPNADVGSLTHGHVADDLTVYGNNAYLSAGECDLEIDTYKYSRTTGAQSADGAYLEQDIAITAYELDNLGVWGQRNTAYTATINLTDCDGKTIEGQTNVQRVYLTGETGSNNITLTDCDFLTAATTVFSNADGAIVIKNCTFTGGQAPVNFNHTMSGEQTVSVEDCTFTNCGDDGDWAQFAAPIRLVNSGSGTMSATVSKTTITDTVGSNGDILLGDGRTGWNSNDVSLTVTETAASVQVQKPGYYDSDGTTDATKAATVTVTADDTLETSIEELLPTVYEVDLDTFIKAIVDANYTFDGSTHPLAKDGKLTVKWSPVSGCFDTGRTHDCTVNNVAATGNTPNRVNSHLAQFQLFEKVTSAVSVKNVEFVYEPADFTICANSDWKGSFTDEEAPAAQLYLMNTGDVTFEDCSFDKVVLTSFNCEGASTVKDCSFSNVYNSYAVKDIRGETVSVTGCTFENCGAAIMVSAVNATDKVNAVTISGNTFNKIDVTGTAPESDDPEKNKVGTRGLIQIASSGDYSATAFDFSNNTATDCGPVIRQLNATVSLDAEDRADLKKLVTGDSSLYVSDSVRVAQIGDTVYYSLADAFEAAESGDTVTLLADLTETDAAGSAIVYDLTGVTFDLNGHTYSHYSNAHFFQGTGGVITNGTMVCLNGGSYALSVGNYEGATESFTVAGVTMTGGISVGCATGVVLEDLTVTGTDACAVELDEGCSVTIKSGTYTAGEDALLNGNSNAILAIEGGTFTAGGKSLVGTTGLVPSISDGTFDTAIDAKYCASGFMPVENDDGTYGVADAIQVLNADGSVVSTYHSLADAFAAVQSGQTVKLLADITETDEANEGIVYNMTGVTFDLNGHTYSHNSYAHFFQGTGGTIKNGTVVCLGGGSYALPIGNYEGATTSFTVEGVTITGGIDIGCATGVTLEDLTVTGTDACAVKVGENCSVTIKSGTYTAGSTAVLDGNSEATLKIEGGTFYMNGTSLVNAEVEGEILSPLVPTISGGKFDKDLTTDEKTAYLADGLTTLLSSGENLYVIAPENSEIVTVETSEEADSGDSTKKNIHIALSKAIVKEALENAGVTDTSAASDAKKTEVLNKTDPNDNPVWVNLIAGIDSDKYVAVDAAQNTKVSTIDVTPVNVEAVATTSAGVQFAYRVDEVKVATTDEGKSTAEVTKAGEVVSAPAIDVDNVETSAYFQVKVLIRQNGSTLATVPATNYVGVLKKSTKMTKAIVPVPWHSLADGENISVSNIVKTANLKEGDKLYVYDTANKKYNVYVLNESKTWDPTSVYAIGDDGQMSSTSSGKPDSTRVARGSGVWLERSDTSAPIVTYGLAASAKQNTELAEGTAESPTWNLVAVPSTEAMKLDSIAKATDAKNDTVIVPTEGAPKVYTVEKDGVWGYSESVEVKDANGNVRGFRTQRKTDDSTLPAGTGFWYVNGGDAKNVNW